MSGNDMLKQRVGLLLLRLSLPVMAGMMAYAVLMLIETYFVARLGAKELAALTLTIPVQVFITAVASAAGVALTSLISRTLGAGSIAAADNIAWHGLLYSVLCSLLFLSIGILYLDDLLVLAGCRSATFALSRSYLRIVLAGSIFTILSVVLGNVLQGEGDTLKPIQIALFSAVLNVLLDPLFMFGLGNWQGRGLEGAAIAGVLAQVLATLLSVRAIRRKKRWLTWSLRNFRPSLAISKSVFSVSLPTLVMELTGLVIMGSLNHIVARQSVAALAVLGILLRVRSLSFMMVYGLGQGTMPVVGFAYGAGQVERVKETLIKSCAASVMLMTISWLVLQRYPEVIMSLFTGNSELAALGVTGLRLSTLFFPVMGPVIILTTVLQATNRAASAMWFSLLRQVGLFLPLLFILPCFFSLNGVWLAFAFSEILALPPAFLFSAGLWRELQQHRKVTLVMLLRRFTLRRLLVWLKC